jgi:large subunit ribosomal protein L19
MPGSLRLKRQEGTPQVRTQTIQAIESRMIRKDIPNFTPGDTVRVHTKIKEGDKERIQIFQGVIIRKRAAGARSSFTVRKVSYGVGVERIFPTHSPRIDHVEVVSGGVTRRARLFYLRNLRGKAARLKTEDVGQGEAEAPAAQAE